MHKILNVSYYGSYLTSSSQILWNKHHQEVFVGGPNVSPTKSNMATILKIKKNHDIFATVWHCDTIWAFRYEVHFLIIQYGIFPLVKQQSNSHVNHGSVIFAMAFVNLSNSWNFTLIWQHAVLTLYKLKKN